MADTVESSKETVPNSTNGGIEDAQNTLLESDVQKSHNKKKISNTVFATKMRNRRREEKMKKLETKEILTSCKSVSVDITRLSSNVVPKLVSTIEHKNRKKKRFQWKLGKTKKRKKTRDKRELEKINNIKKENLNESSNVKKDNIETQIQETEKRTVIKEKVDENDKLEPSMEKDDVQRRKSLRHVAPMAFLAEKCDLETKPDAESAPDKKCSCRRTEPFIGKLNTKEARDLYMDTVLKLESESINQNNNEAVNNKEKGLSNQNNEINSPITSQAVSKAEKSVADDKSIDESKIKENKKNTGNSKNKETKKTKEKHKNKSKNKSENVPNTSKATKELIIQKSNTDIQTKEDTKDLKIDDTSCRRTVPFIGKIPRKLPSSVPEKPIEMHCSNNVNDESITPSNDESTMQHSSCSDVKAKSDSSFKDVGLKMDTSIKNTKKKTDPSKEDSDIKLESSSKDNSVKLGTNNIESKLDLSSKIKANADLDVSVKNMSTTLDSSTKDISLNVNDAIKEINEKMDISSNTEQEELSSSSNKMEIESNLGGDTNQDLDSIFDDIKPMKSVLDDAISSCQRTEPYLCENYHHCSRTLPFVYSVNKLKTSAVLETNVNLFSNANSETESDTSKLHSSETDQVTNELNSNQNKDTNIPVNKENEMVCSDIDITNNLGNNSKSATPVQNGEWKFRRKRQKSQSEPEAKVEEEARPIKRSKVTFSAGSKSPAVKKSTSVTTSPSKTICSLLSLNCTKHTHHHSHNGECPISLKVKQDSCVLLTRLEQLKDPLVVEYLKKTDLTYKIKNDLFSPQNDTINSNNVKTSLDSEKQQVPCTTQEEEQTAKDNCPSLSTPLITSGTNSSEVQAEAKTIVQMELTQQTIVESSNNSQSPSRPVTRMRCRTLSRNSITESLNVSTKRKKPPVSYVEESSDSEFSQSSLFFSMQLRTRSQSRGPTLRERNKRENYLAQEQDEDDMEVEEFTRIGKRTRRQTSEANDSNQDDTDKEELAIDRRTRSKSQCSGAIDTFIENARPRCKSVLDRKIEDPSKVQIKVKTPSESLSNKRSEQSLVTKDELDTQVQADKTTLDKEINTLSHNGTPRLKSHSRNDHQTLKSPSFNQQETEYNNNSCVNDEQSQISSLRTPTLSVRASSERMLATPKTVNKNDSTPHSARRSYSRASKVDESFTPKKAPTTPMQSERDGSSVCSRSSSRSDTSSKYSKRPGIKKNLLPSLVKPGLSSEISSKPATNDIPLKNLKVQLIKLEAVCSTFEDYSASEIELLTEKYIDLLMNSNFSCDTWRKTINYDRSRTLTDTHAEEIDNSYCISDAEMPEEEIDSKANVLLLEMQEPITFVSVELDVDENTVDEIPKEGSPKKSDQQQQESQNTSLMSLGTANATFVDAELPTERNFGAVNISEALSVPASKEKDKVQTIELSEKNVSIDNQERSETNYCEVPSTQPNTILVNGTTMFACPICNKIFVELDLFNQHTSDDHPNSNNPSASTSSAPTRLRFSEKSANETPSESSTKKSSSSKTKKKFKSSDSLKCTICSVTFDTKELLFDHIMTHNEQELQEAYKTAKLQQQKNQQQREADNSMSEESDKEQLPDENSPRVEGKKKNKKNKDKSKRKSTDSNNIRSSRSSIEGEEISSDDPLQVAVIRKIPDTLGTPNEQSQGADLAKHDAFATIERIQPNSRPITICPCHAYETTNQDLQIEMLLLCKTCNVVFRRRDCFEVHYRNSPECRRKRTNNEITKVPKLFCSGCPCVLDSLMDMRSHLEMHARQNCQGTVTFICNICKVAFFGVGGIFYSHWFSHTKSPNFVASRYSFPKLSVVSVLEDSNVSMTTSKSQEGFFYIAEHVCRQCRLPFSSEPELQKHKLNPCQPQQPVPRLEIPESNRLQMIKLICDLCKKYYVSKENFDRHCSERNHLKTPITKFSRLPITANEQAFVCSLCRAVSKSLDDMKEHWKIIHSPIMQLYTCKTCNVVPSSDLTNFTYEKFERHCRLAHKSEVITCLVYFITARYVCNICKFGFETEKSMKEHQVVHEKEKRSCQETPPGPPPLLPMSTASLPPDPQTVTLWVADKPSTPDGGRQVHPVYVHYPGVNKNNITYPVTGVPIAPKPQAHQQQVQIRSQVQGTGTPVNIISNDSTNDNTSLTPASMNNMLRNILNQAALNQQEQQHNSSKSPSVETIVLDSRSNSPVTNTTVVPVSTNTLPPSSEATTNTENPAGASRKSYMTMVNPDFESMLGTNTTQTAESSSDSLPQEKEKSNSANSDKSASVASSAPEPFEVVLVTDDLSENSNGETPNEKNKNPSSDKTTGSTENVSNQQEQKQQHTSGSNETKSFLRVRSIAELQSMKIHLCSMCGLSFDSPQAFEEHSKQHVDLASTTQQIAGDVGRTTPVQMISPMVTQTNKETVSDPQSIIIAQMRHKMSMLTSNGQKSPNDLNTRMNSPAHSNEQQQQQQPYWFASCNGMDNTTQPNVNYNAYGMSRQPQKQHHNQPNIFRRSSMSNSYASRGPPPVYPGTLNSTISSRPSAIQLPERNITANSAPMTKRPSGAATRIPQQNFDESGEHQAGVQMQYNCNPIDDAGSSNSHANSRPGSNIHSRHPHLNSQLQGKSYSRNSGDLNYSGLINNQNHNMTLQQQQHQQQPQQQQQQQQLPPPNQMKIIYTCKYPNCQYRAMSLSMIRGHEKSHLTSQQPSTITSQVGGPQQQRLPVKHVSVSQMPERTRHAMPTSRPPVITNLDKRYICRICNLYCGSNTELLEHVNTAHNAPTNQVCCYVCDYCPTPLLFESEDQLRKHMNTSHNYSCEVCGKRYPTKKDLMVHAEYHTRNT